VKNSFYTFLISNSFLWVVTSLIVFLIQPSYAQDYGLILRKDLLESNRVQSISVKVKSGIELTDIDSLEVAHVEFDQNGRLVYEKYYRLFDIILYSQAYTYTYNSKGQLIEKVEVQVEYPKNHADSSLLQSTGFGPSTKKWNYEYNKKGLLKTELEYLFETDSVPTTRTVYKYDWKEKLIKQQQTNVRYPKRTIYSNSVVKYIYDDYDKLVEEKMHWTTKADVTSEKSYTYNERGFKVSESMIFDHYDRGTITNFEYDKDSVKRIYQVKIDNKEWFKEIEIEHYPESYKSWEYHKEFSKPNTMAHFEYDEKRLLKKESWFTDKSRLRYSYEINYQFRE